MKKGIRNILIASMLAFVLSGCGDTDKEEASAIQNSMPEAGPSDNSLDAYSRTVDKRLRVEEPEDASAGGSSHIFLGNTRAFYFKKHYYESTPEKCWDEIAYVTMEGEEGALHFSLKEQMHAVGAVLGTDHYLCFDCAIKEGTADTYRYLIKECDEKGNVLREIGLDYLDGKDMGEVLQNLLYIQMDKEGQVYLVMNTEEGVRYHIVSDEGELLADLLRTGVFFTRLVPLYDGRVAFWENKPKDGKMSELLRYNAQEGKEEILASFDDFYYRVTLLNENTMIYADRSGVYRSDLTGGSPEPLYLWRNHGITVSDVYALQADDSERISLIYESAGEMNYLCLEPTTQQVEIRTITLAVSSHNEQVYQAPVAEFNKRYPSWHIELNNYDYIDRTVLLTELNAGKGPVLIDTFLTGLEEMEVLWEPLEGLMEQYHIVDELLPCALELGKTDEGWCGAVMDFRIRTLVTGDPQIKDWDYDTFLQQVDNSPELEAIFNCDSEGDYGTYFITNFISHGMEDNFLFDADEGTVNFDSDEFRKALELAKKYCVRKEPVAPGTSMLEGKVLCNELDICRPEALALYRSCYGEDANYIGYPTRDGAAHFLEAGNILAVRKTADQDEKEMAAAFIAICLSYEGQSAAADDVNFHLSVRKDVLAEQIAAVNKDTVVFVAGFGQFKVGDDLNREADEKLLQELIDGAKVRRYFPAELRNILYEELEMYFNETITEDMVIEHLKSRVAVYLQERE